MRDLRHTFGSWLAKDYVNQAKIPKLMAHKNIETSARYMHQPEDTLRDAANLIKDPRTGKKDRRGGAKGGAKVGVTAFFKSGVQWGDILNI